MKNIYHNNFHSKIFTGTFKSGKDSIRLIMLGGSGNVTKNMFVYEYRYDGKLRDILIVDCGIGFPDPEMYGVDLVIPDVTYLLDKKQYIRGIFFTHGHDDHIGGIPYIYPKIGPVSLYATKLTSAFIALKLKNRGITAKTVSVEYRKNVNLGVFNITPIHVTHSIPDASNLIINTPVGTIYHGSDFKFDFTPLDQVLPDIESINKAGQNGIMLLLTDCLGSERPGFTGSEQIIGETIEKEIRLCPGKLIFTTQSSNISRIQRAIDVAVSNGRKVAIFGRSMDQNIDAAIHLGYMKVPRESIVTDRDLKRLPPEKQFLVVAGAQGQPESALTRMANNSHMFVRIKEGDTVVISADVIPGNETNVNGVIEAIYRTGARVSYTDIMEDLHVSGHGSQGDLMLMLSSLGPQYIIPIGGTFKHIMQYRRLAKDLGYDSKRILIPDDGDVLEFSSNEKPRTVDKLDLDNIMVDGLGVGDVGDIVLRDRKTIAQEGIVVIVVPINRASGKVTGEPDIITRGFVYIKESEKLLTQAKRVIIDSMRLKKGRIYDWHYVRKQIEENVSSYLYKKTGRSPLIVPVIIEV